MFLVQCNKRSRDYKAREQEIVRNSKFKEVSSQNQRKNKRKVSTKTNTNMPAIIHKNRIGLLVQEKLHLSKVKDKPTELKHLTERFHDVSTHLSHLLDLLKDQQTRMKKYNESRVKVRERKWRHIFM